MTRRLLYSISLAFLCLFPMRTFGVTELLMFDSEYCTWCQLWEEEIGGIYHLTTESCQAPLRRFDFDTGEYPDSVSVLEPVVYTPTFLLLHNRKEVGRITGYPGADFFWVELGDLIEDRLPEYVRLANEDSCEHS